MQRAAIYARFSTDRQNEKSIDDQVVICRDYAARHGLVVVATYDDRAVSGASIHNRPGMQRLIAEARENRFDVVVAESTSRLGRDQEDRAAIRKRPRFLGIALMTPVDGAVTDLVDGVRAVVDSQQIEDLKHAVRRGLAGVIRDGRNPGGMAYGYAPVKGEPGHLFIVEEHAEVVRRIFREFVAGDTARDIARRLNAEGVAPPRGEAWNASTSTGIASEPMGSLETSFMSAD
jgi:DNA invertase Pin-like site-specific DNA recombinase